MRTLCAPERLLGTNKERVTSVRAQRSTKRNLAATAGGWSARHRRKAILGWLLFVLVAFLIGGAAGQRHLTLAEQGNGQSQQALRILASSFPQQAGEQVLVQGRGSALATDLAFTRAVQDLVARLRAVRYVSDVRSPLTGTVGLISRDRRSALVLFKLAGDPQQAQQRVSCGARRHRRHPARAPTGAR